jgi:hypothetical protein
MARSIVEANGSELLSYKLGRAAFLVLLSNEEVVISIGASTAKVFARRPIIGWRFPRTIAMRRIDYGEPIFGSLDRLRRFACGCMVLDGLMGAISRYRSISELQLGWTVIRNPMEVAAGQMLKPQQK